MALRSVRVSRRVPGPAALGGLDGEPLGDGDGPSREARRGLPRRHVLPERAGARERHEGSDDRRLLEAEPAHRADRRRAAYGSRGPAGIRARGPRGRQAAVPGGSERRHDEHRCDRPARRHRRHRRRGRPVAARRRRLRWVLPSDRPREALVRGDRAERLRHARSAQGTVPALRHGRPGRPRRTGAAGRALRGRGLPAGPAADRRAAELQRVLGRALARLARPARLAPAQAARRGGVPKRSTRSSTSRSWSPRRSRPIQASRCAGARNSARSRSVWPVPRPASTTTSGNRSSCAVSTLRNGSSCRARASTAVTCCASASCRTARTAIASTSASRSWRRRPRSSPR